MKYKVRVAANILVGVFLVLASFVSFVGTASAEAFPGLNGRLIFSDVNGFDLKSVKSDGTDRKDFPVATGNQTDAEYSPDGTRITYRQVVSGVDQVFVANADGSSPQQITTGSDFSFTPSWSPDGTKIVFIRQISNKRIFTMNADGTGVTQLTATAEYFDPEYSPDGTKIVALLDDTDDEVVVMSSTGTGITNLTNNSVADRKANWSPDGTKLVYASEVSGEPQIFTMNPDGTGKTQLTNVGFGGYHKPVYSPDGTKIAFITTLAPSPIYIMNPNGTGITEVDDSSWALEVSWQPLTRKPSSATPNPTLSLSGGKATVDIPSLYTDTYAGIDKSTVAVMSTPTSGTTTVDTTTGVVTYTAKTTASRSLLGRFSSLFFPRVSAAPTDSFTYRVCSLANSGLCATGTVTVNILGAPSTGAGRPESHGLSWGLGALAVSALGLGVRQLRRRAVR